MYDPMTVAFSVRKLGITIWHKDPEKHGNDDSCDWFGRQRALNQSEKTVLAAVDSLATHLDNRPHYPDSPEHKRFQDLTNAIRDSYKPSKFRIPVRWHIWHWRLQIDFFLDLKRWLFSRCQKCGKGFTWGYCPVSTWSAKGPRWFRSEEAWHLECDTARKV